MKERFNINDTPVSRGRNDLLVFDEMERMFQKLFVSHFFLSHSFLSFAMSRRPPDEPRTTETVAEDVTVRYCSFYLLYAFIYLSIIV